MTSHGLIQEYALVHTSIYVCTTYVRVHLAEYRQHITYTAT